jgi:hypothetical protein
MEPMGYNQLWPLQHKHYDGISVEYDKINKRYHIDVIDHYGRAQLQYESPKHHSAMLLVQLLQDFYAPS